MNIRSTILKDMGKENRLAYQSDIRPMNSETFGKYIFSRELMQKMLPRDIYKNILNAMSGREKIKPEYADTIAVAIKEWALSHGATHYSHWFQPLTGASAEKHDAFIDWNTPDKVIEKFNGKQLLQGEPDASSFPSGGLRSTYEARGYTGWDPASPIFLWKAGDGITLCIPSVFFSWTGDVLDSKIPLLRSDRTIDQAALRLLKLTGISAHYVFSNLGLEQEYFVIDRALRNLRPDLVLLGKTVFGAPSPKGQELQDHYFGAVKDRILAFMQAFETSAIELGIPVKTRHNEVAPAQHEVAPVFEKATAAIDHNILLMELMRQTAQKHGLACLLHEKPFAGINGSGKHCNWSLSTDDGLNLLDPTDVPHNNLHFLILLTAILHAVYQHSALLRASIGSASNDYRLGGHEAPPAIVSVYLGQALESLLEEIENKGSSSSVASKVRYDLGLELPDLSKDNTDRNRTSPFAFTGNKFEFRALGSSANPAFAVTVLNLIVAESLNMLLDEIEANLNGDALQRSPERLTQAVMPVLQKYLKLSKGIRFMGDNYSEAWLKEAQKRGLPNIKRSPEAFLILSNPKTVKVFEKTLTEQELKSRQDILLEHYTHHMNIEANLILELFKTQILPAAIEYQTHLATSFLQIKDALAPHQFHSTKQAAYLKHFNDAIEEAMRKADELEKEKKEALSLPNTEKALRFSEQISHKMEGLREAVDRLETLVDDQLWPLPKYRELLFMV
ncbi:glutamine synthetase III [Candidatus Protochlamydia phocaeensis]|uniref:glutamine synthetase III family protein n=1 Tax=Candidatus Protochlamydia phocaeensis TaxID=1414722 RepID=UPI000837C113|nr:glutamine synthetase III [Candidatus Protochlamydia phocaeensis]